MPEIVKPGDLLGVSEEFVAGQGTFEENGKIYSLFFGAAERDAQARKISVKGRREVRPLKEGDLVYAVVHQLYEAMTMVHFAAIPQGVEIPANGDTAFIRISELQQGYVEKLRDCVRVGDVLKARVAQIVPLATYLTIKERDLGVVKALCSMCRAEMEGKGNYFACPSCGSREERKIPSSGEASREAGGREGNEGGWQRDRERNNRPGGFGGRSRGGFGGRREGGRGRGYSGGRGEGRGEGGSEGRGGFRREGAYEGRGRSFGNRRF